MDRQVNRAIVLWESWEQKQTMLEQVFGHGASNDLARQKYDFLSAGIGRISPDATADEKLVVALIKKTAVKLEKQLYPYLIVRGLRRIKSLAYDRPVQMARLKKLKTENVVSLQKALGKLGLSSEKLDLDRVLDFEQAKVSIELVSPYGTDSNFTVRLELEKDASGYYQFQGYTATLKDPLSPQQSRSFTFDTGLGVTAKQAANLLQGRSVLQCDLWNETGAGSKWLQLDYGHAGSGGKPQLLQASSDEVNPLRQQLINLSAALDRPELVSSKILEGLQQGNQIAVKELSGKTFFLEPSLLSKGVLIRDAQQQPITLDKLKRQMESAKKLQVECAKSPVRKIKLDRKQTQGQSLGLA